jgi:predicted small lipoprotein YifL
MHRLPPSTHAPALGPWQRWVLWLLVQALLALSLAAGPRAVAGPLHFHDAGSSAAHDHGDDAGAPHDDARRHRHTDGTASAGIVWLDEAAQATEDATASAMATLWPALEASVTLPQPPEGGRHSQAPALPWASAEPSPLEHRPRA